MNRLKCVWPMKLLFGILCGIFVFTGTAGALTIALEPANAQREVGGKVRVHIYANQAEALISMGAEVSFDPAILQVDSASKYEAFADGWVMDADGNEATTADRYTTPAIEIDNTTGTVTMIGGRLMGASTAGLSGEDGKVLLGWIVFEAVGEGASALHVDLGKYHPDPPQTFDNFVRVGGEVDEPTNVPADLGEVCVKSGACEGDVNANGSVLYDDYALFNAAWNTHFGDNNYNPACDLDGDGLVLYSDYALFNADWNQTSTCP